MGDNQVKKYVLELDKSLGHVSQEWLETLATRFKAFLEDQVPNIVLAPGVTVKELEVFTPETYEGELLARMYEKAIQGDDLSKKALQDFLKEKDLL